MRAKFEERMLTEPEQRMATEPDAFALQSDHRRLQVLVGELLEKNQELRFRLGAIEERARSAERTSAFACIGALLL